MKELRSSKHLFSSFKLFCLQIYIKAFTSCKFKLCRVPFIVSIRTIVFPSSLTFCTMSWFFQLWILKIFQKLRKCHFLIEDFWNCLIYFILDITYQLRVQRSSNIYWCLLDPILNHNSLSALMNLLVYCLIKNLMYEQIT